MTSYVYYVSLFETDVVNVFNYLINKNLFI